ncbi:hypothetical protein ACHAWF_009852 [Thalassiosira exigua]
MSETTDRPAKTTPPNRRRSPGPCVLYALPDSECMCLVYLLLLIAHVLVRWDPDGSNSGSSFADPLAAALGQYRPVSTVRYAEWIATSPVLMALAGRALPRPAIENGRGAGGSKESEGEYPEGLEEVLRPGLLLTTVYISVAWLALPIGDPTWRWALIFVSFGGFCLATYDQLTSWTEGVDLASPRARIALILMKIQIGVYFGYGMLYLLGPGFRILSPTTEQTVYAFVDTAIKATCSAFLSAMRHADALADARAERRRAEGIAGDLQQMILSAPAPIFAVDRELKLDLWNHKFAVLTGLSSETVQGMSLGELLSPECRGEVVAALKERLTEGAGDGSSDDARRTAQFHCEFVVGANHGSDVGAKRRAVSVIMSATAKHDSGGLVVGVVGIGQDRTEVTRYKVIERKQNEFMGVISHELKSPLHGIAGLAENLSQSEKDSGRREQMNLIRSCATRLIDLVSNIMEMSKLRRCTSGDDDGGVDSDQTSSQGSDNQGPSMRRLRKEPVDIAAVVADVCTLVRSSTDKANRPLLNPLVELANYIPSGKRGQPRLPIVEGDAYKITQVFYNLITNACKFCSSGHINISSRVLPSEEKLEILIEDTGIGIAPEAIKRIFEPFEQESNSSKRSFGGIGLGLAISKEVARMHGGNLAVESTVGKGSTFTLSLPVTKEAIAMSLETPKDDLASDTMALVRGSSDELLSLLNPQQHNRVLDGKGLAGSPEQPFPRTQPSFATKMQSRAVILSVDDDLVNQEVIKSTLFKDYQIHICMNGFDAVEYFSTNSELPDLVLLDVMMPGLDGFEVLKVIREDLKLSPAELPVIMLSAMEPADKAVIKSLSKGCNDYVSKPFDPDILKARVDTAVEVKRLRKLERDTLFYTRLLHNIMPAHIVEKLVDEEGKIASRGVSEKHDQVCLLFADIVGWTPMSQRVPTDSLISLLNTLFSQFDELTDKHGVFKADTIGDCYIVAAGHEGGLEFDATLRVVKFGIEMLETAKQVKPPQGCRIQLRVGIHTGPAYSGIVGTKVPKYTFFGDTVNTASRMESAGVASCINLSSTAHNALRREVMAHQRDKSVEQWLQSYEASIVKRDGVKVKGKGFMDMYLICVTGVSPPQAQTLAGRRDSRILRDSISSSMSSLNQVNQSNEVWASDGTGLQDRRDAAGQSQAQVALSDYQSLRAEFLAAKMEIERLSGGSANLEALEEMKIKLSVTTKRLAQARQMLMEKEAELDAKELELQRALFRLGLSPPPNEIMPAFSVQSNRGSFLERELMARGSLVSQQTALLSSSQENEARGVSGAENDLIDNDC